MWYLVVYMSFPLQDAEEGMALSPASGEIITILYEPRPPLRGHAIRDSILLHAREKGWESFDWEVRNTGHRQWSTIEVGGVGSYKVFGFDHMDGR